MKSITNKLFIISAISLATGISSCKKDDDTDPTPPPSNNVEVPENYQFERNGNSTVSYSGQTERLNQLKEIKNMLKKGDQGEKVEMQALLDMYENKDGNGGGHFSFTSTKQLKDKTFDLDVQWFEDLLKLAALKSDSGKAGITAKEGQAGLIARSSGSTILVDANGREFTQMIEKGLMGAVLFNQICNTYLTDEKIGDQVDNENLVAGENYTSMEHHMDEAFGYFGAPVDFSSDYQGTGEPLFWANYSAGGDDLLEFNDKLMNAYKTARAAIVAKNYQVRDAQRKVIYEQLERLAAATAIHYANEAMAAGNDGDRLHVLSECYGFIRTLRYQHADHRKLTQSEVDNMLNNDLGNNFWQTTTTGLNNIKNKLSQTYDLEDVKNDL